MATPDRPPSSAARPAAPPRHLPSPWVSLVVLCVSILMVNLDTTVLNVALPVLVRDLGATSSQLQWIVDAYALVFGGLLLVMGSLADRFGRKWTFMTGLVAFAAGSSWAAVSGHVGMLIAARASMGIGAAMMMPSTLAIITAVFPHPVTRQRAIGVWAGTSGVGIALGPIVGGFLLDHFAWGSVFLINVPVALAGTVAAVWLVPDSRAPHPAAPDLIGALLSVMGLGLLLWGIIEAPVDGFASVSVLVPGGAGVAVIAGFLLWERRSSHPMLALHVFRSRNFSAAVASVALVMFGLVGALFLLTQFLQFFLGETPFQAGLDMLPVAGTLLVVAPLSSLAVRRAGVRGPTAAGLLLAAAGLWWTAQETVTWTYANLVPGMVIIGIGVALALPAVSGSVMSALPPEDYGVGSATNGTAIQIGGALGVAVVGSLLSTRYQDRMATVVGAVPGPAEVHDSILGSLGGALEVAGRLGGAAGASLEATARSAFVEASNLGLGVAAAVALVGCVVAAIAMPRRLSGGTERPSDHGRGR